MAQRIYDFSATPISNRMPASRRRPHSNRNREKHSWTRRRWLNRKSIRKVRLTWTRCRGSRSMDCHPRSIAAHHYRIWRMIITVVAVVEEFDVQQRDMFVWFSLFFKNKFHRTRDNSRHNCAKNSNKFIALNGHLTRSYQVVNVALHFQFLGALMPWIRPRLHYQFIWTICFFEF